jgi:ABC-type sugar transport system ATPase subunit
MLLGDRVAAMADGRIMQLGLPDELYHDPRTSQIARLMGYRRLCTITSQGGRWTGADCIFRGPVGDGLDKSGTYELLTRPDWISIRPSEANLHCKDEYHVSGGIVANVGYLGSEQELIVTFQDRTLRLITSLDQTFTPGSSIDLTVRVADARIFHLNTNQRVLSLQLNPDDSVMQPS